jgi:hypothetical protein
VFTHLPLFGVEYPASQRWAGKFDMRCDLVSVTAAPTSAAVTTKSITVTPFPFLLCFPLPFAIALSWLLAGPSFSSDLLLAFLFFPLPVCPATLTNDPTGLFSSSLWESGEGSFGEGWRMPEEVSGRNKRVLDLEWEVLGLLYLVGCLVQLAAVQMGVSLRWGD